MVLVFHARALTTLRRLLLEHGRLVGGRQQVVQSERTSKLWDGCRPRSLILPSALSLLSCLRLGKAREVVVLVSTVGSDVTFFVVIH